MTDEAAITKAALTKAEFQAALLPFVLSMRVEFDLPTWASYYEVVKHVPLAILTPTVARLMRANLRFFPRAGELVAAAEAERRAVLARHAYEGCAACEDAPGWVAFDDQGLARVRRCTCWGQWQQRLEALGAGAVLCLPAAPESDDQGVW